MKALIVMSDSAPWERAASQKKQMISLRANVKIPFLKWASKDITYKPVKLELQIRLQKLPRILELKEKMMTNPYNIHPLPFFVLIEEETWDQTRREAVWYPARAGTAMESWLPTRARQLTSWVTLGSRSIPLQPCFSPVKCNHCCCALLVVSRS